jgi:flagellar export protein FliJ
MRRLKTVSKVLQFKDYQKEERELEVKKVRDLVALEQAKLDSVEKTLKEAASMLQPKDGTFTNVHEIELFYEYYLHLDEKLKMQKATLAQKLEELDDKQNALLEVYREKKALETLKNRMIQEGLRETSLMEQKEMDSLFLSRRTEDR